MDRRKWFKGDTHFHSTNSDGKLPFDKLTEKCCKRGLDYMIITDHNYYSISKAFFKENMLVIPGWEYTGDKGHVNFWGSELPPVPSDKPEKYEEYVQQAEKVHAFGGTVSVNHPFCKKCGWHMDLESYDMDCVEVWNSPMHIDNMTNLQWWHSQLLKGRRIAAVGGSDYHEDYVVTKLIACPTTYVYAEENTEHAILKALRQGNSFVTNSPKSTQLYLTCGDAVSGEEAEWKSGIKATVNAIKLKRKHILRIWNNNKIIYEYTAKSTENHIAEFEIPEKGFIRAEVIYSYGKIGKKIFGFIDSKIVPADKGLEIPDLAWCFTNPIYMV